ncbi:MAG: hypothetical protein L0154_07250 [Chloroflexi bacterium]|nr:hypothetical protein [Chloroflexota bacterium]
MRIRRIALLLPGILLVSGMIVTQFTSHSPVKNSVLEVEASCSVLLNAETFLAQEDDELQELSLIISLPDGTPIPGVCLTFMLDLGPGSQGEFLGRCTTDEEGVCVINVPRGVVIVYFGNTQIGGIPVNNANDVINAQLEDASVGGIAYYSNSSEPSTQIIVASDAGNNTIEIVHAVEDEDGNLVPLPPNTDIVEPPINIPPGQTRPDGSQSPDGGQPPVTEPPDGPVTVRLLPDYIATTESYDKIYCFYNMGEGQSKRIPGGSGAFMAGGGNYFDLGTIINNEAAPAELLDAGEDDLNFSLQCWGWQGDTLIQIGNLSASVEPVNWMGDALNTVSAEGTFTFSYTVEYELLEDQSHSGSAPPSGSARLSDQLVAPTNVTVDSNSLRWNFDGEHPIGGFRIYRNGALIGSTPPDARSWFGDGLLIAECGEGTQFTVTSFAGSLESAQSSAFVGEAPPCLVDVILSVSNVSITNINDCDGLGCGTAAEMYGYLVANGQTVSFGLPEFIGVVGGSVAIPTSSLTVSIGEGESLEYGLYLFDHDALTPDDTLCIFSQTLSLEEVRDAQVSGGQQFSGQAAGDEAECSFTVIISPNS